MPYIEDFRRMLLRLNCPEHRVLSRSSVTITDPEVVKKIGMVDFYQMTIRVFKLASLEDICEGYGQVAYYLGTIPDYPHRFQLDDHHTFVTGMPMLVCGNTAAMVGETRFAPHFKVLGDHSVHYGPFDCSTGAQKSGGDEPSGIAPCCS